MNHPRTGERLYIEAQLLPGAPRVIYTSCSIEYDYGKEGVKLTFGRIGPPMVSYRNMTRLHRSIGCALKGAAGGVHHLSERSGLSELSHKAACGAKGAASTAIDGVKTAGKVVLTPAAQIVNVLPLTKILSSSIEQRAAEQRDAVVRRAQVQSAGRDATIPTVR
jgi:hypothetical protein